MPIREVKPLSPSQWKWLMEDMKSEPTKEQLALSKELEEHIAKVEAKKDS